jgi:hypothetical protein
MAQGITPGRYDPDLIPQGAGGAINRGYDPKTGFALNANARTSEKTEIDLEEGQMEYEYEREEEPLDPMDDEEFRYIVKQAIEDSQTYIDSYLAPERERAMAYYLAEPFGNEEEGRSQVVLTEVRDTVLAMLPSLLRIFTGGDKILEFVPKSAEDVASAEQATDLINYVFYQENPGFRILHDAMKDGLLLKTGVLTWYVREDERVEYHSYSGLTREEAAFIMQDQEVKVDEYEEETDMMTGISVVEMKVRRIRKTPRYVVECVPPEQFLIDNEATSIDDAIYVGRRRLATISELVAMGYDREILEMNAGTGGFEMNGEVITRNPADQSFFGITSTTDETTDKIFYVESYIRIDKDGDGIAELHKVCTVGNGAYILHDEVVQTAPFSLLEPDPTPHTIFGQSIADQTMDLQLVKSSIMRNTLDSLAQSIHPRTVVVEGQVNIDDVLNVETGAIIRARAPGMVQPLAEPFVGQQALGVMGYLDEIKTQRTGISRASQGLDAEALQSTTRAAVQAQLSSSQERIEMISRLFADGMKRCFQGLLQLVVQHQDKPKIVRLRNQFVPIDPRGWDVGMDMIVNIALGRGSDEQRMVFLQAILAQQKEIIANFGPYNPLVSLEQYRDTLAEITKLSGYMDPSKFWKEVSPQEVDAFMQQQSQSAQRPDPATVLAQVEAEKIKADIVINAAKQELERQKAMAEADLQRDKLYVDALLRAAEINAKYNTQVDMALIKGEVDRQRAEIQQMFRSAQAPVPADFGGMQ